METLERVLAQQPFFAGLPPRAIELLVGCASNVRFEPGQFIFRMGEPASRFYLVRHGSVALELYSAERGPVILQTVGDGEALGWSWLIPPYHWHLDGRALIPTLALSFDAACLRGKFDRDHDLGYEMYRRFAPIIAQRLQATRLQALDVHKLNA